MKHKKINSKARRESARTRSEKSQGKLRGSYKGTPVEKRIQQDEAPVQQQIPKYPFARDNRETHEPKAEEIRLYWIIWKTWGKEGRADTADLAEWKRYLVRDCGHKLEDVEAFTYSDALKVTQKAFGQNFRKVQKRMRARREERQAAQQGRQTKTGNGKPGRPGLSKKDKAESSKRNTILEKWEKEKEKISVRQFCKRENVLYQSSKKNYLKTCQDWGRKNRTK